MLSAPDVALAAIGRPSAGERGPRTPAAAFAGDDFEELRTDRPGEDGFPELDFDVGELERLEKLQAANCRGVGVPVGRSAYMSRNSGGISLREDRGNEEVSTR